jgi:hypothetical protein
MRKAICLLVVWGLAGVLFLLPMSVLAQTKTSGLLECGKNDPTYTYQIPDEKGFSFAVGQSKCIWTKPFTVDGLQSIQNIGVGFDEEKGTLGQTTSVGFTQYKNGDKAYWKYSATYDTKAMTASGTWTYTRGTGKLLGIKGSGTCACKLKADGGSTCEVKGDYTLPAAKK